MAIRVRHSCSEGVIFDEDQSFNMIILFEIKLKNKYYVT